eukprot:gnl/MRDRNA2_/MRDRNA2_90320_c0_seq1.p1 gnl/MRDRNA2_/MRDRNA2_90320_c0~~gnl/MRDRNA2_/MRDRNA2_90320_c0_seq1.p1  ORF type:complete len:657 (+),score=121.24 gnl/MRDRNA2_/MRDRNA2_90320_c0_seq1:63-2033(+)
MLCATMSWASAMLVFIGTFFVADAGHCYNIQGGCEACIGSTTGSKCGWCAGRCQMAGDSCANPAKLGECGAPAPPPPGPSFFEDHSAKLTHNPVQKNYGVSVTDIDGDGQLEAVVAGFGAPNLAYKWNSLSGTFDDVASGNSVLQDSSGKAIGVAACDIDGDGFEELYVLNTDAYSGATRTTDLLIDLDIKQRGKPQYQDLFKQSQNQKSANYVAGRSCACVDIMGTGVYSVLVANYGGPFKLFEMQDGRTIADIAPDLGMAKTTGGRALIAGPIVSNRFDVFANNEGYSGRRLLAENDTSTTDFRRLGHRLNFFFVNQGDGTFLDAATALGLLDASQTGRGTALLDSNGDGFLDIVYGNWQGYHRLFVQTVDSNGCVRFVDQATSEMATPSPIRTVIVADFDNDGYEEIFWNNIPGNNRLFRKLPSDSDWTEINIGDAVEPNGYGTGAGVGDFDGDGVLELFVSHGESSSQPMSYYRLREKNSNHWLRVLPRTEQGAPARGAQVTLSAGGRRQIRVVDPGSGYLCQQEPVAHFGLGSLTSVDSVTIQWPDGAQLVIENPKIDHMHDVKKPKDAKIAPRYTFSLNGDCLKRTLPDGLESPAASDSYGSTSPVSYESEKENEGPHAQEGRPDTASNSLRQRHITAIVALVLAAVWYN